MTQKHTSATDASTPINVVLVTLDNHVNGAIVRAEKRLVHDLPGIHFRSFAATEWEGDPTRPIYKVTFESSDQFRS